MSFNIYPGQRIDLPNGVKMLQVDPAIDTDETVLSMRLTDPFCFPLASKDDIKKAKEVGLETAKKVFGDEFDEKEANKLIDDVIKDNKGKVKDGEELSAIIANSFRAE